MTQTNPAVAADAPALPASEDAFIRTLLSYRIRPRATYVQNLVSTHKDALLPLLKQLLLTEDQVFTIPISRPVEKESDLAEDGGNPSPQIDTVILRQPQSNASPRYHQRSTGIAMATTLAQMGSQPALELLLANLRHPHTTGKKQLIQSIALNASDEQILAATKGAAPAIVDALVSALQKLKRKDVTYAIMGKPRAITPVATTPEKPLSTRLRADLNKVKEFEREAIWNQYSSMIDVTNQAKANHTEPGEDIKDVILSLQETLPPLHPWLATFPEQRSPKLCNLIEHHFVSFLNYDAERTMNILKKTSHRNNQASIPNVLHSTKRVIRYWCHRDDDGALLGDYIKTLMDVEDGILIKDGLLPYPSLFRCCRGPVVGELVRKAIAVLKNVHPQKSFKPSQMDRVVAFAVEGVSNLVRRLTGCSTFEKRTDSTEYFHKTLQELIALVIASDFARHDGTGQKMSPHALYTIKAPLLNGQLVSFPPLGQLFYDQIKDLIRPNTRDDAVITSTIESLLLVLKAKDTSVYSIPDDGLERPFSSIPAWDNKVVFTECVERYMSNAHTPAMKLESGWIAHLNRIAPSVTNEQRDSMVQWVLAHPGFKTLLSKDAGQGVFPILAPMCTNVDLRHKFIYPLVFGDKSEKDVELGDNAPEWAAYLDIRIPAVRELLVKETSKPAFEDRLKWISAILRATRSVGNVQEWLLTLKWLVPKIRNEILPNLQALSKHLMPDDNLVPRQYLDNATLEQAQELASLYLTMDSRNAAAITPVSGITRFLDNIANEAWKRFINQPDHPFYHVGHEIPWRRKVASNGEARALEEYSLMCSEPNYSDDEPNEQEEILRRQAIARGKETKETEGGSWGLTRIRDGEEESFVKAKLNVFYGRWKTSKSLMNPDEEKDDLDTFKILQKDVYRSACFAIHKELGWRWKRSPTLVAQMEVVINTLAEAEELDYGEKVLNWWNLYDCYNYVDSVAQDYTVKWLREHRDTLTWHTRYRNMRIRSTNMTEEVELRVADCQLENGKRDQPKYEALMEDLLKMSPSAIHLHQVREYLISERPDLLTDEHLTMTKGIIGIFNQEEEDEVSAWDLFVKMPIKLSPHQCELLKARHLLGMTDPATPFTTRVEHAQNFVQLPTTTIDDVANALATPSLPSRIIEAILMFLPTMGEPACSLQVLLAPVYLHSHLARTSIHAVENALKYVPLENQPDYILPLFPSVGQRQLKVTIQKEGVRLACASMSLLRDPRITNMIKDLWIRTDLNSDVRVVILQSLLGLVTSPEGREDRYKDTVEWIWTYLSEISHSSAYKKAGVATVLLAVSPSGKYEQHAPRVLLNVARTRVQSATLADLALVSIPHGMVDRYVEECLFPMCATLEGEDAEDVDLVQLRTVALQVMIGAENWFTPKNAVKVSKEWRRQAALVPLDDDPHQLWFLLVHGISRCVGREAQGALEHGGDGVHAWKELCGAVQDMADRFLDKSLGRGLRQKAMEDRIRLLNLGMNGILSNFEKAQAAGAFSGNNSDIVQPLMSKTLEPVTWTIVLSREIRNFNPQDSMTEAQINEEAFRILVRISELSNRYLSEFSEVQSWVQHSLLAKSKGLFEHLGKAILEPREELLDWVHLDELGLMILQLSQGRLSLEVIGGYVERLACQDPPAFYWSRATMIARQLYTEVWMVKRRHSCILSKDNWAPISALLTPIMTRAKAAGYTRGPDSIIMAAILDSDLETMMTLFPKEVGPMLHHCIVDHAARGVAFKHQFVGLASYGNKAIFEGFVRPINSNIGLVGHSPAEVLIIESLINGRLETLDFTRYTAAHDLSYEVMEGLWFKFSEKGETHPIRTLKEVDDRWNQTLNKHPGYFTHLSQVANATAGKSPSPIFQHTYQKYIVEMLDTHSRFLLMRPFIYLEFMRVALTAPVAVVTVQTVANQMAKAFKPEANPYSTTHSLRWGPSLSLALDLAEYVLHEVREEVAIEGQREAQMIEKLVALFLKTWMANTVVSSHGKMLAEMEDVEALERRYLKLVDELCEDGSGGQSLALELGDFLPGGPKEEE
ncbi:hypothetical protein BGZ83_003262 [Gryganskiella cystojenkinii]|nr:hypothetical protein BGZ83_003262 [Gryganskiella cystojenkinii]